MNRKAVNPIIRFQVKYIIDVISECWNWQASISKKGYGQFYHKNCMRLAHTFSYEYYHGIIPKGYTVDHLCKNRKCVNPKHLEAVPHIVNVRRAYATKTHCIRGHVYDGNNTYISPKGYRFCKTCRREQDKKRK